MAIILKNGECFSHIPKTGGSFITHVLNEAGLIRKKIGYHKHLDWTRICYFPQTHRKILTRLNFSLVKFYYQTSFCFVRHPIAWYESFWNYCNQSSVNWKVFGSVRNWHPCFRLAEHYDTNFNAFVTKILNNQPGYVSELYSMYAHPKIDFVGKTENLTQDLLIFLRKQNYKIEEEFFYQQKKVNVSEKERIIWDKSIKNEVLDSEKVALLRYSY